MVGSAGKYIWSWVVLDMTKFEQKCLTYFSIPNNIKLSRKRPMRHQIKHFTFWLTSVFTLTWITSHKKTDPTRTQASVGKKVGTTHMVCHTLLHTLPLESVYRWNQMHPCSSVTFESTNGTKWTKTGQLGSMCTLLELWWSLKLKHLRTNCIIITQ